MAQLVLGCVRSAFLTYPMRRYPKFPAYTAPFAFATWLVLIFAHAMVGIAIDVQPRPVEHTSAKYVDVILREVAAVMFGANRVTGILFLLWPILHDELFIPFALYWRTPL